MRPGEIAPSLRAEPDDRRMSTDVRAMSAAADNEPRWSLTAARLVALESAAV